jgi:hypothetical protein
MSHNGYKRSLFIAAPGLMARPRRGRRGTIMRQMLPDRAERTALGWAARDGCRPVDRRRTAVAGRKLSLLAFGLALTAIIVAAQAEQRGVVSATEAVAFHIPAQPLAGALQAFGERTGIQLLYESDSAAGLSSSAVEGDFTPSEALTVLLNGSGLKVRYSSPDAITIALPPGRGDEPPSHPLAGADLSLGTLRVRGTADDSDRAPLHDFIATVQSDVQTALRRDPRTRSGSYRLVIDLWLDSSHAVQRTELFQSTGDRDRDTTVRGVLQGLVISRAAPPSAHQPVRVAIAVKSLQ